MKRSFVLLALALSLFLVAPSARAVPVPVLASDNVELLGTIPTSAAISSIAFSSNTPYMYVSTFRGLEVFDISNAEVPRLVSVEPMLGYQNEAMSLGERGKREKFVLFASNQAAADTTGTVNTTNRFVTVVEVTDPFDPKVVGHVATPSRTHTVSCGSKSCEFAYSDGRTQRFMSIIDLTDFRNPKLATPDRFQGVVQLGHDSDLDDAGILWAVGGEGAMALDLSNPVRPVILNSTNEEGVQNRDRVNHPYNNFILHNSTRPHAERFTQSVDADTGLLDSGPADVFSGNVLLATEEDLLNTALGQPGTNCGNQGEGSFSTWRIPFLDAEQYARINPDSQKSPVPATAFGGGTIEPLDRWNTELLESGIPTPAGAFCSAHYFDYREDGFVAQGWYEQGVRILDVRDPHDIKQVGYYFTGASEAWGAYWVPRRNPKGHVTGQPSDLVYVADNLRGIDILRVTLPGTPPSKTKPVRAPILPQWVLGERATAASLPSEEWGFLCRVSVG